ncbi:MAG: ATP-binding protein [Colwellia sp.]|nr:ATP-binding protein [Colwellia sp.]
MAKGFRIAARALRQLGAELITSDDIALNELIKNAIDAKSQRVTISIKNPFSSTLKAILSKMLNDKVSVNECFTILKSNLVDSVDDELEQKILNDFVCKSKSEISSALRKIFEKHCKIIIKDTGVGMSKDDLQDSFLVIGTPTKWIEKEGDADSELLGEKGVGRLSMMRIGNKSTVTSGKKDSAFYSRINFDWKLFDNPNLFLDDVDIPVIDKYSSKNTNISGTEIVINNLNAHWDEKKVKAFINYYLRRLQNPFSKRIQFPIRVKFNGRILPIPGIYSWFKEAANFQADVEFKIDKVSSKISLRRSMRWRGQNSFETREWNEDDLIRQGITKEELLAIGAFKLDLLWFNRGDIASDLIDYSATEIKTELNVWCGGYTIYRDNFRIGLTGSLEDDWLKSDVGALKSSGFSFNRYQTVGSLSISKKNNPHFIDSANREKLIGCRELDNFKHILTEVVNKDFKSFIEFYKGNKRDKAAAEMTAGETLRDAKKQLKSAQKKATSLRKVIPKEDRNVIDEISHVLKTQYENVRKYEHAVKLSTEQRIEVLELAGLGMVVEKVVHELARLTQSTSDNLKKLEKNGNNSSSTEIIKVIREQINVTNKRIRTVDALSPSGRNRKAIFNISGTIQSVLDGFSGRFERHEIQINYTVDGSTKIEPYNVKMVLGLVALVLENLITNSIYWVQESVKSGETGRSISIDLDTEARTVSVSDNGPGIDEINKEDIFNAYYTNRKNGKGLGLYISKEIAEYHGTSLYLDSFKSDDGRLRTFILELPKT